MPKIDGLSEKQEIFCKEYIWDWNATRAAKVAGYSEDTASSIGAENLRKPQIKARIKELQEDIEKVAGISRLQIITEHQRIMGASMAAFHKTWLTRKEFDELTEEQKACIAEISTQIKKTRDSNGNEIETEFVKIKLYDKQKSMDSLTKILGYEAPKKSEITFPAPILPENPTGEKKDLLNEVRSMLGSIDKEFESGENKA